MAGPPSARTLAPLERRLLEVTRSRSLGAYHVLHAADPGGPPGGRAPIPGQFAMLQSAERWGAGDQERPYLSRAFSYARFCDGEAQFLLEDVGPGTRRLCELQDGERLWLLGPLGVGFTEPDPGPPARRALLVGGGVGIAPLAIWQDALLRSPEAPPPVALLGFRDGERARGAELLAGAVVATDDGSVGHHGLVTELLAAELERDGHATVYACGPAPMLEAVRATCARLAVPAQLALESGMACGFGACFGCVVPSRDGYLRVCVEGPVIDAARLERVDQHAGAPA